MKIVSSTAAAQSAVSGFAAMTVDGKGQQINLGVSTVAGMKDGAQVANELLSYLADLVSSVKGQADKVQALAAEIEARDQRDAGRAR